MIFKTIDDNSTLSGRRIVSTFEARRIAQEKVNASLREHAAQLEIDKAALTSLEQKVASGTTYEEAYAQSMKRASAAAKEHAITTKGLAGTTDTFVAKQRSAQAAMDATATSSKGAVVGVKALKLAFNMFSGIVISFAISKIIEGFQYLAESAERAKEKLENIRTDLSENNSSYESNRKTLEGLRSEYDELTDKADKLGGVQNLTNEEYQRYTEIISQILGITPKLITGWDDEGNAISNKNGLLQQSIDLLDEEYEKSLRNNTTKKKNEDVANGVITELDEFENSADTKTASGTRYDLVWKDFRDYVDKAVAKGIDYTYKNTGVVGHDSEDVAYAINEFVYGDSLYETTELNEVYGWLGSLQERISSSEESLKQFTESLSDSDNPIYQWFTDEQIDQLIEDSNSYFQELDRIQDDRETYYQKYKDQLNWNARATTDNNGENAYKQLSDESKTALTDYIDNLDYASIKTSDDFVDMANNVKSFTKLLASDSTLSDYMSDIYTPQGDDESIEDYSKRVNDAIKNVQKYIKDNNLNVSLDFGTDENPKGIKESVNKLEDSYDQAIDRFSNHATEKQSKAMAEAQQNLEDEYQKISDWGLDDYADQIKNGTLPSQFGNVDMDNRQIIDWNIDNIERWKDALSDIKYYDKDGNFVESYYDQLEESAKNGESCIDTVFGDLMDKIEGYGDITALSFSHVVNNDDGTFEFLGQKTAEEYLYGILDMAKKDGDMSIDHILELDKKGFKNAEVYDAQGKVIGETYIHGIISGFNENAEDISELTHFAGKYGAVQIAKDEIAELEKQFGKDGSQTIKDFFDTEGINTQEEIDYFNDVTKNAKTAEEAIKAYTNAKKASKEPPVFSDIFSLKDTNDTLTTLGKISESIDTIQNAYNTLNSAIEEYNDSGSISIDALQSIIALGDDWYDYLLDENGALKLDKESLQALTLSRLADMKAQIQQNMIDSVKKINDDASAKEYLTSTNYKTADSIEAVTDAMIDQALAEKRLLVDSGDLSQENYDLIEKKLRGDIEKSNLLVSNISLDDISLSGGSSSSKSNSKSNSKDSIDIIDFAEEKLNHLNTLIDDTQKHIEQLEGSANKNALVDSLVDINKSKMNTLEQVSDLYTRMADEYLAKIHEQYKGLAKEGGLEIDKFIGDGNSEVTDAIKNYQTWADKVDDINSQLIELKQTLKDLEVDKFNNIKDDFDSMYNILDKNKSKIKDVVSLLETQEQNVGQGFYEELITETKSQIQILKEERDTLTSQMTSALRNGIEYGSNEWKDMYDALQDVDSSIISCENDLKDFQKSINELHWNTLEKIKDQFSSISSELDSLNSLLEKDTVTSNGKFTSESITRIGLLAQKYELARNEVSQYNEEIKYLDKLYSEGKVSINEYTDKLNELRDSQFSSISTAEEAKKAILDLAESRVNEAIDAINDETDAYEELINKQKESLQAEKDLYEYKKNIVQKEKEISSIKRKINAMMGSDDAATIAEREKLEAELAEAVNDLEDYKYDHAVDTRSDALDKELEDYKDAQEKRTEALKDSLKNEDKVLKKAIAEAKSRANEISKTLLDLEKKQNVSINSCIINPWRTGSSAIAGYNQALNSSTSNFTAKLNGIKTNIQSVQTQANNMASTIMSAFNISNNSGVYEAISKVRQNLYNTSVESIHLKQWISSALNSTYGNGAVNSINNVRDAANKAGSSVNGLRYEINQLSKSIPDLTTNMTAFATGAYAASSYKDLLDMIKRNEAKLSAQSGQGNLPSAGINKYLPFPMFAEGGVVNGKSNKLAQSFGEDVTIFAKKGERVLSLEQTKSFDKLVSNLPEITPKLEDFVKTFKLPQNNFTKVGSSTPIINIDAGITVQGNIDKNFAKEFENMQNQLTKNVTGKIATSLEKLGMQKNNCRPL